MIRSAILSVFLLSIVSIFGTVSPALVRAATLDFSAATYSVSENGSSFDVTVIRTGTFNNAASVTVKTSDITAIADSDYQNISTVLNWGIGETASKTVTITVIDNGDVDGDRTFQLELINLVGDTAGLTDSAVVTVEDYEEGHLALSASSYAVAENENLVSITVERTEGTQGEVGISVATQDNTAKNNIDYESFEGSLNFLAGETSKTIDIVVIDDELGEVSKDFLIQLSGLTGGAVAGEHFSASIVIVDDDSDFTPGLKLLSFDDEYISQQSLVDLNQASLVDSTQSFIDTINAIPVLQTTDLVAEQNSDGLISILVGTDKFYLRPTSVVRSSSATPNIVVADDHSGYLTTADGVDIQFQPALLPLDLLQEELASVNLPEITVTDTGNLTIQVDQGPPPLEQNDEGTVVINNSYYDRYNLRPLSVATVLEANSEGLVLVPHPVFPNEVLLGVIFSDDAELRQQLLTPAPFDAMEFAEHLDLFTGVSNVNLENYGIVTFNSGEETVTLFADYIVRRVSAFDDSMVGISAVADANGDGVDDLKMTYSNGDEQYFFIM